MVAVLQVLQDQRVVLIQEVLRRSDIVTSGGLNINGGGGFKWDNMPGVNSNHKTVKWNDAKMLGYDRSIVLRIAR